MRICVYGVQEVNKNISAKKLLITRKFRLIWRRWYPMISWLHLLELKQPSFTYCCEVVPWLYLSRIMIIRIFIIMHILERNGLWFWKNTLYVRSPKIWIKFYCQGSFHWASELNLRPVGNSLIIYVAMISVRYVLWTICRAIM